ncbi:unnamed protein product [Didymodactylos carnosus]|uniref:Uncharacterized protein n=1 Tax=Didymodactylos carnosus TaxID=1234261 RepID=A0A815XG77_9BILA|nr:unnamed protein product [Didymodactylos carnosus]CAF1557014.1 unnamed protein product [Didymodactylos carnosus]CAF4118578.1 unnamed protein product [Didymodactylos carnosus]CAF4418230.1 unnamed protein product [Didymodactylos carnosus]
MIANDKEKLNEHWNEFESAATLSFARSCIDKEKPETSEEEPMPKHESDLDKVDTNQKTNEELKRIQFELQKLNANRMMAGEQLPKSIHSFERGDTVFAIRYTNDSEKAGKKGIKIAQPELHRFFHQYG